MSERKPLPDWIHLFIPLLIVVFLGVLHWGFRLATRNDSQASQPQPKTKAAQPTSTPTPKPTPAPSIVATPSQPDQVVVVSQSFKVSPQWVRIRTDKQCVPIYATPDTSQPLDCFPNDFLVIDLSQQQNGFNLCQCWYPALPSRERYEDELWKVCSVKKEYKFWINSSALVQEKEENAKSNF